MTASGFPRHRLRGILPAVGTLESLWVALDTLRTHKLRSFLTMLGVIFGVMAVVVMVALIEGARASVIEVFEKLGSDVIIVAFDPSERIRREERGGTVEGLTVADLWRSARCLSCARSPPNASWGRKS